MAAERLPREMIPPAQAAMGMLCPPTLGPSFSSASHTRATVSAGRLVQKRHRNQSAGQAAAEGCEAEEGTRVEWQCSKCGRLQHPRCTSGPACPRLACRQDGHVAAQRVHVRPQARQLVMHELLQAAHFDVRAVQVAGVHVLVQDACSRGVGPAPSLFKGGSGCRPRAPHTPPGSRRTRRHRAGAPSSLSSMSEASTQKASSSSCSITSSSMAAR